MLPGCGARPGCAATRAGAGPRGAAAPWRPRPPRSSTGRRLLVRRAADAARHPAEHPPPGPFRPGVWRSPLRGQWLTSLLGLVLLCGLPLVAVTGLLSYAAYDPRLPGNDETPGAPLFEFFLFSWPTHPPWLYRLDQAVHITLGLALLPVVLAKLWSVLPKLFSWPPVRSPAHALERLSLVMIVGGVLLETVTGILQYPEFLHSSPALSSQRICMAGGCSSRGFVIHVTLKFRRMRAGLASRSLRRELRTSLSRDPAGGPRPRTSEPARLSADGTDALAARPAVRSRRCVPLLLAGLKAGQSIGGWTRWTALFGPRGLSVAQSGMPAREHDGGRGRPDRRRRGRRLPAPGDHRRDPYTDLPSSWRLPQHMVVLPIACVEGWSVAAAGPASGWPTWPGWPDAGPGRGASLDPAGRRVQVGGPVRGPGGRSAVPAGRHVNGGVLPWDHGYPARTIIPNAPGVHNTKWVSKITFLKQV